MASTVYLVDDLAAILQGLLVARANPFPENRHDLARAFNAGFVAAIRAMATTIHVSLEPPTGEVCIGGLEQLAELEPAYDVVQLRPHSAPPMSEPYRRMESLATVVRPLLYR